jgi:cyclopropane-fatty-acyl-phospholipid synthase
MLSPGKLSITPALLSPLVRSLKARDIVAQRPTAPLAEIRTRGRLHSVGRDRLSVAPHYDTDAAFFRLLLGESMAYSCALFPENADTSSGQSVGLGLSDSALNAAQLSKLDMICRRLGLDGKARSRLLDFGCGWGSLALHAASQYGAEVVGVTVSPSQAAYVRARVMELDLSHLVRIEVKDWRRVRETGFDAISVIEMGEHVGERRYGQFAEKVAASAGPAARIVVQQMSRRGRHPGGGPFIESFVTPDMTMRPVGQTIELLEQAGLQFLEGNAMDAHYAQTIRAWERQFWRKHEQAAELLGDEAVRVWELYLAGSALAFEQGRMGVDQLVFSNEG